MIEYFIKNGEMIPKYFVTEHGLKISRASEKHIELEVPESVREFSTSLAWERYSKHYGHFESGRLDKQDPIGEDRRGHIGEEMFGAWINYPPDRTYKPKGDEGFDYRTSAGTIALDTARNPKNLFVRVDDVFNNKIADIYVLAGIGYNETRVMLIGWETLDVMRTMPSRVFNEELGYENYYKWYDLLRPMNELLSLLEKK